MVELFFLGRVVSLEVMCTLRGMDLFFFEVDGSLILEELGDMGFEVGFLGVEKGLTL